MISVIIPTYNRADLLPRAILSIKNQTFKDLELIVVDDCSTDNTSDIVNNLLGDNDTYIQLNKNSGSSAKPRNEALKICHGEYITLLDSDDYLAPHCLEIVYRKMIDSKSDIGIIYPGQCVVDLKGNIKETRHRHKSGYLFEESLGDCICGVTGALIKAECFKKVGLFDECEVSPHHEMFIRISKEYKFDYVDEYLAYYLRDNHKNFSAQKNIAEFILNILEKHKDSYDLYPSKRIGLYRNIAILYRRDNNFKKFIKYALMSNPDHNHVNYRWMALLIFHPKLPETMSYLYYIIGKYFPVRYKIKYILVRTIKIIQNKDSFEDKNIKKAEKIAILFSSIFTIILILVIIMLIKII